MVTVDVKHGSINHFSNIRTVERGSSVGCWSGITDATNRSHEKGVDASTVGSYLLLSKRNAKREVCIPGRENFKDILDNKMHASTTSEVG